MGNPGRPESSTSRVVAVMFIVIALVIAWFCAPMFLPMWKWRHVDFKKLAAEYKVDEKLISMQYQATVRYAPRGNSDLDPYPFQILTMTPDWQSQDPENRENEDHLLVRCTFVSDKAGTMPSSLMIGNTFKDRYFKAKVWRLPAGALGFGTTRPVLIYDSLSLDKVTMGESDMFDSEIRKSGTWENDDLWEERDDGFDPGVAAAEAAEKAAAEAEAAAAPAQ
ncbi:MAG: hypothetical protein H0X45_10470 [Planctomycetes bacterium]|nr:hypothetical protein [Planctomycetota bacterium]